NLLKDGIAKGFLELATIKKNEKTIDLFINAAMKIWLDLDIGVLNRLIDSMLNRI
ncbi:hypothetical protein QBC45DRAFT_303120, partial [Copromyces sp. CBS 386.78]